MIMWLGVSIMLASGIVCMMLDTSGLEKEAAFYWFVGTVTGGLGGAMMAVGWT